MCQCGGKVGHPLKIFKDYISCKLPEDYDTLFIALQRQHTQL